MSWWGVDSLATANKQVGGSGTLYDTVVSKLKRAPTFWGRYVVGKPELVLTQTEANFLFSKFPVCRIIPIYRTNGVRVQGSFEAGRQDAIDAVNACTNSQLHVPNGVVVYADIEPLWKPSKNWILGWWDGMWNSRLGRAGGLYCNAAPNNKPFTGPYCAALDEVKSQGKIGNIAGNSLLWGQTPFRGCKPNLADFSVDSPSCHPTGSRVWQYAINCLPGLPGFGGKGAIDMNLATDEAFSAMWAGTPPPTSLPAFLLGWWEVPWRGRIFFYFFEPNFKVSWTFTKPTSKAFAPVKFDDTATVTIDTATSFTLKWNATGSVEKFQQISPGHMAGMWNGVEPLVATKMF